MIVPSVAQMIPVLQTAIGPMILISGLGLILLTTTNRLGRTIDRVRILVAILPDAGEEKRGRLWAQLEILWRRARLIRMAILLASMSALAAAILIIVIFLTALWMLEAAWLIGTLFICSLLSLIGALIFVILDINQSLAALKLELAVDR
ncbi:MAG: DUF2721 domain-containing protein [Syntrophales bacterium]